MMTALVDGVFHCVDLGDDALVSFTFQGCFAFISRSTAVTPSEGLGLNIAHYFDPLSDSGPQR